MFFKGGVSLLGTDHAAVWAVREEAAEWLWSDLVSGEPTTHYRALPSGHRLRELLHNGPNWYIYANDPSLSDRVETFLRRFVGWEDQQKVLYAHGRGRIYQTFWGVFLRHWRLFVKQDESLVFGIGRDEFVLFYDGGYVGVGSCAQHKFGEWSDYR
jgi:hypothetical protein